MNFGVIEGAKRILSVFLLVVMLCTFFAFPAEAATNYWPSLSSWNLGSDNISLISGGTAFDLAGSNPSNKGVAMGSVSLPAGKSYRLTGKFSFARRGTTASAIFSFLPANGDEIIIWQGAVGVTDINIDKVINLRSDQVGGAFFVYIETGGSLLTIRLIPAFSTASRKASLSCGNGFKIYGTRLKKSPQK